MRIDAHQHYWAISRGDYGWIAPELPTLYRDYMPEDLAAHLEKHRIDGSIVVQAAPTVQETEYLFGLANRTDSVLGVVGWLDLFDPTHRAHYDRYREHPKFVGFRMMIQDMADHNSVLEPSFVQALQSYAREDIPVDLLMKSDQLDTLIALLDLVPGLRGVVDHIGKPRVADQIFEPWAEQMLRIARHPNIYCKLSGMVTEADHRTWRKEHIKPYIRHALQAFGSERAMFGSDWPVCLLAAGYDEVVDVLEDAIPATWGEEERTRLFGANAKAFYKLRME